jgi:sec-independent protein translocase protein TatB
LPQTLRTVGQWIGKVRGMARHFTSGVEAVIREAELEEMERKWREENERIMRQFPALDAPIVDAEGKTIDQSPPPEPAPVPIEKRELP